MSWSAEIGTTDIQNVKEALEEKIKSLEDIESVQAGAAIDAVVQILDDAFEASQVRVVLSGAVEPDTMSIRIDAVS